MKVINNVTETVKDDLINTIGKGDKLSIAAACFSFYAYEALKKQLDGIDELRFIFTSPTFLQEKEPKKTKFHVATKTIFHCIIGVVEFIGIPVLIAYLTTYISPFSEQNNLWQWIERTAFCFAIYEVIIIGIRKMQIDVRKDALIALKTAYSRALLSIEENNKHIESDLLSKINKELDTGVLNQTDVIKEYEILEKCITSRNTAEIKLKIISLEHIIDSIELFWNYTILLRLFK